MKVVVTGTRGIPGIQGGVERHCEELYPLMQDEAHQFVVTRRRFYAPAACKPNESYKGVAIKDISVSTNKYMEAFLHTFLSVLYARKIKADIVHIHAIGPSLCAPIARLLGMKVVVTHHGADYVRSKWGRLSKLALRLGEWCAVIFSNHLIVISKAIKNDIERRFPNKKNIALIPNGLTHFPQVSENTQYLRQMGIEGKRYILSVGRIVKEKEFHRLVEAFRLLTSKRKEEEIHLVIAGAAPSGDEYADSLIRMVREEEGHIHLPGFANKEQLACLYAHAALYVQPSSHEGLPIALLEAMSFRLPVLASNIEAHRELALPDDCYLNTHNAAEMAEAMEKQLYAHEAEGRVYDLSKYDWNRIAGATKEIYDATLCVNNK